MHACGSHLWAARGECESRRVVWAFDGECVRTRKRGFEWLDEFDCAWGEHGGTLFELAGSAGWVGLGGYCMVV